MMAKNNALLSFDIEEFDLPREHGGEISLEDGVTRSSEGTERILNILKRTGVKATFFVTGNFAKVNPGLVRKIAEAGHEVACHGVDHFSPKASDPAESKKIVEETLGGRVYGYRQPRMFKIDYKELKRCRYKYDSSINPAFVPGRYNNFRTPRRPFLREGVTELPVSAATGLRIPLFWLSLHLFPKRLYLSLAKTALRHQGYFATYFHPWEFTNLAEVPEVPSYIRKNSGEKLERRLEWGIRELKRGGAEFLTYKEFLSKEEDEEAK